jgi:hypothetical protein
MVLPMGTFWEFLFMISSRRLKVNLLGLKGGYEGLPSLR